MLQPFVLFEKKYLPKLAQLKKIYLVTQSYSRACDHFANEIRTDILITDYDDPGLAQIHWNAVKQDKFASIIKLDNHAHKQKLLEMLSGEKYRLFWSVIASDADLKKRIDASYKANVRQYIARHTTWRVTGDEGVKADGLEVIFGELFLNLKWRTQKVRIKFEDIEKT